MDDNAKSRKRWKAPKLSRLNVQLAENGTGNPKPLLFRACARRNFVN
jgi:hypothetical protein